MLALQGDVREHLRVLRDHGAEAVAVRRPEELAAVDGLVLPGGESTTIVKLARIFDLLDPLRARIKDGLPVYGSCAGMILLADRVDEGGSPLEETIALSHTILVMRDGRIERRFDAPAGSKPKPVDLVERMV